MTDGRCAAALLLAACAAGSDAVGPQGELRADETGGFDYACSTGPGLFDGETCLADLPDPYVLYIPEDGLRYAQIKIAYGSGHADPLPARSPSGVRPLGFEAVGYDDRYIVGRTFDGAYYVIPLTTEASPWEAGREPLTRRRYVALDAERSLPPMRTTAPRY